MKKSFDYAELSTRSCFSFLRGASHPEQIIQQAYDLGYSACALTDLNGFYGMVRGFYQARQLGFPFLVGTEISLENSSLLLIAKNFAGYKRICRLLSEAYVGQAKTEPKISRLLLENWLKAEDLFLLLPPREFPELGLLNWLRERMPIVQLVTKRLQSEADHQMKKWLENLPKEIPRAWTWDAHFHDRSRFELYEVLQCIRENTPLSKRMPSFNRENYLKPLSYLEKYRVPSEWISTTREIADECHFSPQEIRYRYPHEWLPHGKTAQEFLRDLCFQGITKRFPTGVPDGTVKQLEHELRLVKELQYEDYFLTVWDIVNFARSQKILCQGRGSAANSVICYLLEITSIDPIQMNLLFERFISKEREEAPDIDVDFEHERREEVIQYIYQKYGRHRAGMVATLITYRTRSAIRDVGKALEVDPILLESLSKKARWREKVLDSAGDDIKLARVFRLAKDLKGFPRHLGQHTGGLIICQDRLDEISPIEPARMENRSVVQWDKYDVEKLGLLKIDVLSLGMLTCLRKSFDLLKQNEIANLELHTIPANDAKTYDMISRAETVGVFQIESRAQMSMLPRLRPRCFYDLVVEVAIIRPGPIQGGMVHPYLRRRLGIEKISYAHPSLKPILEKTMGVPIFQEQVMKMAIEVAGYSPGEADALRRAMGAWKKTGNLTHHAEEMCRRLIAKNIPKDFAEKICKQILGFGEYGFPESHAASFALLTYASAYLKAHYPSVFLCSLLNSMPMGFYPFHVLNSSFMREGAHILPVDLERSEWEHTLEQNAESIRLGFRCAKGVSEGSVQKFIQKRQAGEMDLLVFNVDERAALSLLVSTDRRSAYWKALDSSRDNLNLPKEKTPNLKHPHPLEHILLDFELMESTLRQNPVELMREKYWDYPVPKERLTLASQLKEISAGQRVFCFGMVQIVQMPPTAKGMVFITAEDETGFLNFVLTPQVFKKFRDLVQSNWMILIEGKLQKQDQSFSILINQVIPKQKSSAQIQSLPKESQDLRSLHTKQRHLQRLWGQAE